MLTPVWTRSVADDSRELRRVVRDLQQAVAEAADELAAEVARSEDEGAGGREAVEGLEERRLVHGTADRTRQLVQHRPVETAVERVHGDAGRWNTSSLTVQRVHGDAGRWNTPSLTVQRVHGDARRWNTSSLTVQRVHGDAGRWNTSSLTVQSPWRRSTLKHVITDCTASPWRRSTLKHVITDCTESMATLDAETCHHWLYSESMATLDAETRERINSVSIMANNENNCMPTVTDSQENCIFVYKEMLPCLPFGLACAMSLLTKANTSFDSRR